MLTDEIGIGIISFNRPRLLQQLLQSLEAQTHLDGVAFHLFQDGAVNAFSRTVWADPVEVDGCVDMFRASSLANKHFHIQKWNVGIGINQFVAMETLTRRYEYMAILEDDIILSPHWLKLVRALLGQVKDREDIFSSSLGFRKLCPKEEADQHLDKLRFGTAHWWGEVLVAERWARARPHFMEYYRLIKNVEYRHRPHDKILEWFGRKNWTGTATSQDGGKECAVFCAGMRRVVTVVNRGISTGAQGTHFRPQQFLRMGFDQQEPYVYDKDAVLERFVLPEAEVESA